ncbi:AAA family ATPase [Bradyrhizobium sp. UFLA05-109]
MLTTDPDSSSQVLWEDGERVFCRGWRTCDDGNRSAVLVVLPATEHPSRSSLDRLAHEYALRDELDGTWAVRPLELTSDGARPMLVLEDKGGEALHRLLGAPMDVGRFLRLAIGFAAALGRLHQRGLVHKDIKPANILVNGTTGEARLTGFGIASRLPRERQAAGPPETLAGTLAYIAPEQTGRMNRSIDSRSDLYALGVTFYEMLTATLPFTATDPMDWVHCHLARTPLSPADRLKEIPSVVSAIVMKLLAKTAEDRYQTAAGLASDLRRCLIDWEAGRRIDDFALGEDDMPDRLLIPEKLYGRTGEVEALLASFDRIVGGGPPELVLVSGYSGIGKSSVVNELHKALVPQRGLFGSGKFDQFKRDIPYATLAQAFQGLVRPLLSKSEADLAHWRLAFREALGPNAGLIVALVPEVTLVIGEPPPVPELAPLDAQRRFQQVFRQFIGVFARPEHPLALFLDDLQWLDAATLDLLDDLLTRSDLGHLLLIGAYRDNEVTAAHPMMRKLDAIKGAGGIVSEITLGPLASEHLRQLIADALRCEPERSAPLADMVHDKTDGNPFFAIQFIASLADERLLTFDHDAARWSWDLDRIRAKRYTDNVVDLMVDKLTRLPVETQQALQLLACVGSSAEFDLLEMLSRQSTEEMHDRLWEAARAGFVFRTEQSYRFLHDRVQEAAYMLIPENLRPETHLRIGWLLAAHTPPEEREKAIFEIVNQLNRGAALIASLNEREQLAELNLLAGQRAKSSTAHASALKYCTAGLMLLTDDRWERRRELVFALELLRAECEFLTGELTAANKRLAMLSIRAASAMERAIVACLRIDVHTTLDRNSDAVAVGLEYFRHLGIEWSAHPTQEEARSEYDRMQSQLGERAIEDLIELPLVSDPASLATFDLLLRLGLPARVTDVNLYSLTACRGVNLSLERGNCDASCAFYSRLGVIAGPCFGDYQAGYRFARLGYELTERRGLRRFEAKTYQLFGDVLPWTKHVKTGRDLLRRAVVSSNQSGDLTNAVVSCSHLITNMLAAGDPLIEVEREAERSLAFAQKAGFGFIADVIATQLALVRMLRGLTRTFGSLDGDEFDEIDVAHRLSTNPNLVVAECWYWIRKLQACFIAGDYAAAVEASSEAQRVVWTARSFFEDAEFHFYAALSRAVFCDDAPADQRQNHVDALADHHRELCVWEANCPENFENRAALVGAEIARVEGRVLDAERLYEQAIRSAQDNGFVHNEAIASELAARFYAARGFETISRAYLREARSCYLRWGAAGKVRNLDQLHPRLTLDERASTPMGTIEAPVEHLDLATVIKVSQAISGAFVLEKLLETLMRTAIEQSGAVRGLLILSHADEPRIAAEATTGETIVVELRDEALTAISLPESVVHYVLRVRESIIIDDAAANTPFADDPYIRQRHTRSVLCMPLLNRGQLIGVLYLENNLTPHIFAPARITVLKLLAAQAAISLENTRLYCDLAEREAKIRRLVDANIIGIVIFDFKGQIIEANDAFLRILGFDRNDLDSGRMRWLDLIAPEWHDRAAHTLREIRTTGSAQPFERDYVRKDGSKVPVLIGAASLEPHATQGVAFVLDLTERKRAESEARESERRYRETQLGLAHANRVATMGQLTASIAHEVSQPIGATIVNAESALRWLNRDVPDLDEARRLLARIKSDGSRAGNVVSRIRGLVEKTPPRKEHLDMNEAIGEIIDLAQGESRKSGVSVKTQFAEGLPAVTGDRTQLQQVMLNLILNAVQAMSEGDRDLRELQISTQANSPDGVLVSVRDSGSGIRPENLDRLFDPFYTTKSTGMGMGLAICRSIVEGHRGRIWATANIPRGTAFHFTIPAAPQ